MQNLTYNNLYLKFTFNTIWSLLTKFWINEVIKQKSYQKIWLTLTVYNSSNKSFTLITNLPFNTNSYTDVLIVLKQVFNTNFFNDQDILNTIRFKYHFEHINNYKKDLYITNMLIYILSILLIIILLFCTFIICIEIYSIYNIEYIDKEILNNAYDSLKNYENHNECNISTKRTIFSPFIELFNADYIPSKFVNKLTNDIYVLNNMSINPDISTGTETNTTSIIKTTLNNSQIDNEVLKKWLDYYEFENEVLKKAINDACKYATEAIGNK